jgi:hypothetical protein
MNNTIPITTPPFFYHLHFIFIFLHQHKAGWSVWLLRRLAALGSEIWNRILKELIDLRDIQSNYLNS